VELKVELSTSARSVLSDSGPDMPIAPSTPAWNQLRSDAQDTRDPVLDSCFRRRN